MSSQCNLDMPLCCGIKIENVTIQQLQEYMVSGQISSTDLTKCYLRRIELVNPYIKLEITSFRFKIAKMMKISHRNEP